MRELVGGSRDSEEVNGMLNGLKKLTKRYTDVNPNTKALEGVSS